MQVREPCIVPAALNMWSFTPEYSSHLHQCSHDGGGPWQCPCCSALPPCSSTVGVLWLQGSGATRGCTNGDPKARCFHCLQRSSQVQIILTHEHIPYIPMWSELTLGPCKMQEWAHQEWQLPVEFEEQLWDFVWLDLDLLEFINEPERKERKVENSKRKTCQTKVACHIFVGDLCRIVYLFVWYNFLCILGCFCCCWKSCFTQCVAFFFGGSHHSQEVNRLLVCWWYQAHHQGPAVQMSSTKKLPCFLSQTKKKRVCQIYSQQEATTVATSTVASRVTLQPPPPHHVQTDPILQNSGRNHCHKLWVVENCEEAGKKLVQRDECL